MVLDAASNPGPLTMSRECLVIHRSNFIAFWTEIPVPNSSTQPTLLLGTVLVMLYSWSVQLAYRRFVIELSSLEAEIRLHALFSVIMFHHYVTMQHMWCGYEVLGMIPLGDLIAMKTCPCMFPLIWLRMTFGCFKGTKNSGYGRHIKKMWRRHWKLFHNRCSKNISNCGNIVWLSAQLVKGSTSKVTPLSKLWVYGCEACNKIIPWTW
jgi:hypothetical protein